MLMLIFTLKSTMNSSTVPPHFTITVILFHCSSTLHYLITVTLFHHTLLSLLHCATVPLHFTVTVPLCHHTLLSLLHCVTVPPHFTVTVTLFCSTTLYYHCYTVPPQFTVTVTLCHCSTTLYCHRYTFLPHLTITVTLCHHTLLSLLHCATVPLHFTVTVTLFHCSTTRYYQLHCATVPPHFTITVTAHFQTLMNDATVLCLENIYNRAFSTATLPLLVRSRNAPPLNFEVCSLALSIRQITYKVNLQTLQLKGYPQVSSIMQKAVFVRCSLITNVFTSNF